MAKCNEDLPGESRQSGSKRGRRKREKLNVDIFVAVSRRLLVTKRLRVSSANIDKGVDGVKPSF